jgi:hypothetical protein
MILGLSISTFTTLHVIISLIGIASGLIVLGGMSQSSRMTGWTALFLSTTVLTTVTGFLFPISSFTPALGVGIISIIILAVALVAIYVFRLTGWWRWIYVSAAVVALYLNVFVLIVQSFQKLPFLQPFAPTQSEPPFVIVQSFVLLIFVAAGIYAVFKFHPERKFAS